MKKTTSDKSDWREVSLSGEGWHLTHCLPVMILDITVPAVTHVRIPSKKDRSATVKERDQVIWDATWRGNGTCILSAKEDKNAVTIDVPPGSYHFTVDWS